MGAKARISVAACRSCRYLGEVVGVSPGKNARVAIRIAIPNPDLSLKPGMTASIHIMSPHSVFAIPSSALRGTDSAQYVYVASGVGQFVRRRVVEAGKRGGIVYVRTGLSPGDRIVMDGGDLLDAQQD